MPHHPTWRNRLLYYELYDTSQTPEKLLRTVSYTYWDTGEASNITIKDEDPTGGNDPAYDWYHDLALYYEGGRQTLRLALWDRWKLNQYGNPTDYERLHAREFRYEWAVGGPRERYLAVDYDPSASNDPNSWTLIEPVRLTDYLGETPYADADVTNDGGWSVSGSLRYLFPSAQETVGTAETQYYHGDLIGSTMLTTDDQGAPSLPGVGDGFVAYTAFGEILDANGSPGGDPPAGFPRYQYAGAWGYESGLLELSGTNPNLPPTTLQHVGFRWYDPALGRFVQRDPIGLAGGLNVYAYVLNHPVRFADPLGLLSDDIDWEKALKGLGVAVVIVIIVLTPVPADDVVLTGWAARNAALAGGTSAWGYSELMEFLKAAGCIGLSILPDPHKPRDPKKGPPDLPNPKGDDPFGPTGPGRLIY